MAARSFTTPLLRVQRANLLGMGKAMGMGMGRPVARRFLNTETAPNLHTAKAKVFGARTGHIESEGFTADLAMPKALGGSGEAGKTNPEELFAGGYAACFQSALNGVAGKMGIKMPTAPEDAVIESSVELVGDLKALDLGLRVNLLVKVKGVPLEELEKAVERAKEVCPYSRATEGNVYTTIKCESL